MKLKWKAGAIVGDIHYKYLLHPSISKPYIEVVDGKVKLPNDTKNWFLCSMDNSDDLDNLKRAVKGSVKDEKKGIHDILKANDNILDVEIAFGTGGTDESGPSAPRLDFAAIHPSDEGTKLVFYEAKRFDNKELRAKGGAKPKVVEQIETYSRKLKENYVAIIDSYSRVSCNLWRLRGLWPSDTRSVMRCLRISCMDRGHCLSKKILYWSYSVSMTTRKMGRSGGLIARSSKRCLERRFSRETASVSF